MRARLGSALAAIAPLTPSATSSVAAFSGPLTTTLGVPRAAASTTMRPRPSRSDAVARQAALATAPSTSASPRCPVYLNASANPSRHQRSTLHAQARRRRDRAEAAGAAEAQLRTHARERARASPAHAGLHRRRPDSTASAGVATYRSCIEAGEHGHSPRNPSASSRLACRRERQKARCSPRIQSRWTSHPTVPTEGPGVRSPVRSRPHLVPIDDEPVGTSRLG